MTGPTLFFLCPQELRETLSVHVGEITSRVQSVRSGSVPASRPSGSVTGITTVETTAMRTDAVSSQSSYFIFCFFFSFSLYY